MSSQKIMSLANQNNERRNPKKYLGTETNKTRTGNSIGLLAQDKRKAVQKKLYSYEKNIATFLLLP
jgi:hypothetical protein